MKLETIQNSNKRAFAALAFGVGAVIGIGVVVGISDVGSKSGAMQILSVDPEWKVPYPHTSARTVSEMVSECAYVYQEGRGRCGGYSELYLTEPERPGLAEDVVAMCKISSVFPISQCDAAERALKRIEAEQREASLDLPICDGDDGNNRCA